MKYQQLADQLALHAQTEEFRRLFSLATSFAPSGQAGNWEIEAAILSAA